MKTEVLNYSESQIPHLLSSLFVFKCFQEFARRALGKIHELQNMEEQSDVPAATNTQRAYKEASVKAETSLIVEMEP